MIKKMAHASVALMALFIFGVGTTRADSSWLKAVKWQTYDEAQPAKNSSDRKIFIYFSSKSCGYCRKLEKEAFANKAIANFINANYMPIHVDSDKERQLARRFGVRGVPDLRFFTPENKLIAKLPGYVPPKTLLNLLQYIQTDSYKTMALNEFVKNKKEN